MSTRGECQASCSGRGSRAGEDSAAVASRVWVYRESALPAGAVDRAEERAEEKSEQSECNSKGETERERVEFTVALRVLLWRRGCCLGLRHCDETLLRDRWWREMERKMEMQMQRGDIYMEREGRWCERGKVR